MGWLALLLKLAHVAGALAMGSATRIEQASRRRRRAGWLTTRGNLGNLQCLAKVMQQWVSR